MMGIECYLTEMKESEWKVTVMMGIEWKVTET